MIKIYTVMKKFIIPVLFCLTVHIGFAQKTTDISISKVTPNSTISFASMDNAPLLEGCESAGTSKQQNKCTADKIQALIQKNFDTNTAKSIAAKRDGTNNTVYVRFIVNKQGTVENIGVRANNNAMKKEVKRILASLPTFSRGTHQGNAMNVSYSLKLQADLLLRNAAD
jgi:outer membrane biosynthesis protein TonB